MSAILRQFIPMRIYLMRHLLMDVDFDSWWFQIQNSEMKVYYITLTVLFLPILPLGAVAAKRIGTKPALLGIDTKYNVYGRTNSSLKEILSCYALRWGIALFALSIMFYDSSSNEYLGITSWNSIWNDIRRLWDSIMGSAFFWIPIGLLVIVTAFFADKFESYYKHHDNNEKESQK